MINIYINAIASTLASDIEINDAMTLQRSEEDCERIVKKTGVRKRPIAATDEYTSDLAYAAARAVMEKGRIEPKDIDTLIVCTQTPDHLIPGVSACLHGRLDLPRDCLVMDINQGCSGFVVGTQVVTSLLKTDQQQAILVNADTYSRLIRPDDMTTRVLFGDAGTATLFSRRGPGLRSIYSRSFAKGAGYEAFIAHNSALRRSEKMPGIYMDGPEILTFALQAVPEAIDHALRDNNLQLSQIRMVAFHQANSFVIGQLVHKLGLSAEQSPQNCAELGNTVSASIPLLLSEQMCNFRAGDLIMAIGFGVGLSWGVSLFQWETT